MELALRPDDAPAPAEDGTVETAAMLRTARKLMDGLVFG